MKLKEFVKRYGPDILMFAGKIGVVAGTVYACKKTLKLPEVNEIAADRMKFAKADYAENGKKSVVIKAICQNAVDYTKLYIGPAIIEVASLHAISRGYSITKKNYITAAGVAGTFVNAYYKLNQNLIDECGEETANRIKNGIETRTIEKLVTNEKTGKEKKVKEKTVYINPERCTDPFSVIFDNTHYKWVNEPDFYHIVDYLVTCFRVAQNEYDQKGAITFNRVLDIFGFPGVTDGLVGGWSKDDPNCPDKIDAGIFDEDGMVKEDFLIQLRGGAGLLKFNAVPNIAPYYHLRRELRYGIAGWY